MILQSLVSYYETLAARGEIARLGWGNVRIQLALHIDACGNLLSIVPLESSNEKGKPNRRLLMMPAAVKRSSGIRPNFLWDNAKFLLGVDSKENPERALQCFEASKAFHQKLLHDANDPFAKAIRAFFDGWTPGNPGNPLLAEWMKTLESGANLTFLFGSDLPPGNAVLSQIWQRFYDAEEDTAGTMRCLVTGQETLPQATHPVIKNVRGAQSMGAALVAFNASAYCSYGREQNLNAPMSKYAAFAYTTAMNQLLADNEHCKLVGNTTVIFWTETAETQYQDAFSAWMDGNTLSDNDLFGVMDALAAGRAVRWNNLPLNPQNGFFVLGIAPNAARLSVRFFLRDTFGDFARHMEEHYARLNIVRPEFDKDEHLPLYRLLRETVNPNATDKTPSPQMAGDTLRAILMGTRYPATLFQQTQLRIKAEGSITRGKAAIIKAYLLKNTDEHFNKEALTVQLNKDTLYQPYILGRLFSVLEAVQKTANPSIKATIKDKYFTSACATPAVIFPTLMNLAQKHLRKMNDGTRIWYSRQIGELTGKITENYPAHLSLNDQGIFQLGYYHQTQERFEKKEN